MFSRISIHHGKEGMAEQRSREREREREREKIYLC
jgi:hypothetical protein